MMIPVYVKSGDFAVSQMGGTPAAFIRVGQWLNGSGFADYEHAFVYLGGSNNYIVEAEPGGARLLPFHYGDVYWSSGLIDLTGAQRGKIVTAAMRYVSTPYSFPDYAAIAAHRLHLPLPGLKRYVASTGHMICSQLVAQCYTDAGVNLFADGRWPGYVTPGDLYQLLESKRR